MEEDDAVSQNSRSRIAASNPCEISARTLMIASSIVAAVTTSASGKKSRKTDVTCSRSCALSSAKNTRRGGIADDFNLPQKHVKPLAVLRFTPRCSPKTTAKKRKMFPKMQTTKKMILLPRGSAARAFRGASKCFPFASFCFSRFCDSFAPEPDGRVFAGRPSFSAKRRTKQV